MRALANTQATRMDADWEAWVATNLRRGCNRFDMLRDMTSEGLDAQEAEAALGLPSMPKPPHSLSVQNDHIRLFALPRFLTPAQCQALCDIIQKKRRPSEVVKGGEPNVRTSTTCDMYLKQHAIVDEVDALICDRMGFLNTECEIMQGQHYEIDQHFSAHCDYFADPKTDSQFETRGGRTWTFMVYLTPVAEGGETEFTKLGFKFTPEPGTALVWCNLDARGRPNPQTEHRGHPVRAGTKVILTKWFREIPAAVQLA